MQQIERKKIMTDIEAAKVFRNELKCIEYKAKANCKGSCEGCGLSYQPGEYEKACRVAIKKLENVS